MTDEVWFLQAVPNQKEDGHHAPDLVPEERYCYLTHLVGGGGTVCVCVCVCVKRRNDHVDSLRLSPEDGYNWKASV